MSLNTIYMLVNAIALVGWASLFASAFFKVSVSCIAARIIPAALAICYSAMMLSALPFKGGDFSSLSGLTSLFAQPQIALVGWVHYLAFDLFIGAWELQTAKRQHLPNVVVVPSMILTMVLGPLGLLVFFCLRYVSQSWQGALNSSLGTFSRSD